MTFNDKKYIKKIKQECKISNNAEFQKECNKVYICKLNKCRQ
jgi:hypothetical protein